MSTSFAPPEAPRQHHYPVHVSASDEPVASRWLWLVKWLLAIPHYIVLTLLWVAFAVLSIVAFFAILFTGRYPRAIFEFNTGVMRWSWRVAYYAYGTLGTDRYPPFTLAEDPSYPAHLDIDYPEHLSRGLVLVKWWLLAIPHYLVVGVLVGGGSWAVRDYDQGALTWGNGGLVSLLVLIAGVILLVTGSYPRPLYDLLLGLNRWVLRVGAYAGLMTDVYPPFRLDQGPHDPDATGTLSIEPSAGPPTTATGFGSTAPAPAAPGWTAGRTVTVVAGALLALLSLGLLTGGGAMLVANQGMRTDGYLTSSERAVSSSGYAVALTSLVLDPTDIGVMPSRVVGDVRLRVTAHAADVPVFVGIARTTDVDAYLTGVAHTVPGEQPRDDRNVDGGAPALAPGQTDIWTAQASGTGTQNLLWTPQSGDWAVVVMNADASAKVSAAVDVGAKIPWLGTAGGLVFGGGALLLLGGITMVVVAVRRASGTSAGPPRRTLQP